MTRRRTNANASSTLPGWFRWTLIATATLTLCSCRSIPQPADAEPLEPARSESTEPAVVRFSDAPVHSDASVRTVAATVPVTATVPVADSTYRRTPACTAGPPLACAPSTMPNRSIPTFPPEAYGNPAGQGPWSPDGLARPWPRDEYIHDGGDQPHRARVSKDWSVRGLDLEDTIAHFDTLDGTTHVEPTNRVHIYAPRFAATRRVTGLEQHQRNLRMAEVGQPLALLHRQELQFAASMAQPLQPGRQIGTRSVTTFRERLAGVGIEGAQGLIEVAEDLKLYEDLQIVQRGVFEQSEKARLAISADAAIAWTHDTGVQVVLDGKEAAVERGIARPESTYHFVLEPGKPRLRIVKLASTDHARPGDVVRFTIRFDNIGDQPIGNVTVMDNLSPRLEYVPESAACTLDAEFVSAENEGESLVLRWEIIEPMEVGAGGVIRFECRVR